MAPQARYWLLTIPHHAFTPYLPPGVCYIKGQLERGDNTGYLHWQVVAYFPKRVRLAGVKAVFGDEVHAESTKSDAAEEYVWKEDTRVEGTQFELGKKSVKRNCEADWEDVWEKAKSGDLTSIPADIRIRSYHTLKRIRKDYTAPEWRENIQAKVFWGPSGTGKSHTAWNEAGRDAYIKSSTTKWWDGYMGQRNVIIDEFRGQIGVEHLLKWLDKYPCTVEEKGGQVALSATNFWICSNLPVEQWYPGLDQDTLAALRRRLTVTHFNPPLQ